MKTEFSEGVLYLGDSLEIIKQFGDDSVDTTITDPPYNVGIKYDTYSDTVDKTKYLEWCAEWYKELQRITKHNILIFTGNDNYFDWIKYIDTPTEQVIWYRSNSMVRTKYQYSWRKIEPIFFTEKVRNIKTFHDYYDIPISVQSDADFHPTPKPLKLLNKLMADFSFPGDTILDIFAGSGTTLLSAMKNNRKFIGIEISPKYYKEIKNRLTNEESQYKLF